MGLEDRILDKFEEIGKADRDEGEIRTAVEQAKGDSVRPNNLFKTLDGDETVPIDLLDDGEQPHYFLRGSSVDVEGDGAGGESITGWDRDRRIGGAFTLITEQRVLVIANHFRGYDEHTIPYDSINTVNLNNGLLSTRLSLQTRGATYHLSVSNSDDDEAQDSVNYLRENRQQKNEPDSTEDPLDQLEKLQSLYQDGVLTQDEFEEKKASLLDEV
ncbi:PH domain-containing protein [Haloarcula laminariae]|uniref:PH domain-containing protein n=1 Tax=Haloarcula laminariae TaxID=2961577 RepID=UPI002405C6AC|nr:PH domain-containing protein [Halomicroarcula sp. FL173]